ncbi:uncharacterized protein L3040_001452 [Drepanopeziza brunnea f. sp. 'multigermtubi']|uniref:uncharacterized protein n=1 Tax=Drepanopeziza brunnea f. sp. 'multigermtubi' TaxID=698441 RepID=UPI00239EC8E4|nr:hypothetical protein L3040_001452 [Drepanopeziza brunnea f. sp. 'multigermtubi']
MPPRNTPRNPRVSAPENRVYTSTTPLTQSKLPIPRKQIRSYGKKTSRRIAMSKQETLTQMWDGNMSAFPAEDENGEGGYDEGELEQMQEPEQQGEVERSIWDVMSSSPVEVFGSSSKKAFSKADTPSRAKAKSAGRGKGTGKKKAAPNGGASPSKQMPPPQTPRRRILATEIPSSQSPAGTPFSTHSRASIRRSPLEEKSPNIAIPFNFNPKRRSEVSPEKIPVLEVRDTYATEEESQATTRVLSSPGKRMSPTKSVRWVLPDEEEPGSPSVKRRGMPGSRARQFAEKEGEEDRDEEGIGESSALIGSQSTSNATTELQSSEQEKKSRSLFVLHDTSKFPSRSIDDTKEAEDREIPQPLQSTQNPPPRSSIGQRTVIEDSEAESDEDFMDDIREDDSVEPAAEIDDDHDDDIGPRPVKLAEPADVPESMELDNDGAGNAVVYDEGRVMEISGSVDLDRHDEDRDQETFSVPPGSPLLGTTSIPEQESGASSHEIEEQPETCYGEIGLETQFEVYGIMSTAEPTRTQFSMKPEVDHENIPESVRTQAATAHHELIEDGDSEEEEDSYLSQDENAAEKTQYIESQRLSTQHVQSMAARTAESDVFVSVHPSSVTNIVKGKKNHEIRAYSFPPNVSRIWLYETSPTMRLTYMAEIGPGKKPGEMTDFSGLGNADFNNKSDAWRAYEILQVYKLARPRPLSELKENGWLKIAPKKTTRVAPAVIDELMANLLPPLLYPEGEAGSATDPTSSSTDTQEIQDQLQRNVEQFTQSVAKALGPRQDPTEEESDDSDEEIVVPGPRRRIPDSPVAERVPSSSHQATTPRPRARSPTRPPLSQATTVDLTQTPVPKPASSPVEVDVVWESPARPVRSSSTPPKLPMPSNREDQGPESVVPFSMASSQLLTKSQLLSDSLLFDHGAMGPPPLIMDSDDEIED